jgi:hypothetical protein
MNSHRQGACASRTRRTRTLPAAFFALAFAAFAFAACLFTPARGGAQTMNARANPSTVVGAWHASAPNGLRVATLTIVPDGEGFAGAFVGYDYDRALSFDKPLEGAPPKVSVRSGSLLIAPKLEGHTFTFRVQIRHPSPPPDRPAGYEISGEVKLNGGDTAELKLSAPHKADPLVLKLTRE